MPFVFLCLQLSSKIDSDLFLEDEAGSGHGPYNTDDEDRYGSGNGSPIPDDDIINNNKHSKETVKPTPKAEDPYNRGGGNPDSSDIDFQSPTDDPKNVDKDIFHPKPDSQASFFSQPGILAGMSI